MIGRLATPGGTLTSDLMEFEVKRALEWLSGDRHESRRHAAVLVLRELARNSPTLFYAYVPQVLELIWIALRDPKVTIRESAADCLSSCLEIISQRETALRIQWYTKMLEEAQYGLKVNNADWIHGSLLAYRELLLRAGMFMHERYNEVCEVVLRHRDHKDGLIRRTVVSLIPSLAGYNPEEFVATYLHKCMGHLLGQLKKEKDRSASFIAIGQVAIAVGSSITPYLDHILGSVKDGLAMAAKGYIQNVVLMLVVPKLRRMMLRCSSVFPCSQQQSDKLLQNIYMIFSSLCLHVA
jgi:serine/threonine-protein kinase mTOR